MNLFLLISAILLCQSTFAQLEIKGTPPNISENIEKRIAYKMRFAGEQDDRFLDQLQRETIEAIKPYGYFAPKITISQDPQDQHLILDITLNQKTQVRHITITYTEAPNNQKLETITERVVKQYQNAAFDTELLENIAYDIKEAASHIGYNDLIVTRGYTRVNRQTHLADITYVITPNEKNLFGEIIYPEDCNQACFNRYHTIREGDAYNPSKLVAFQKNLMQTGLYTHSNVKTTPRKGASYIQDIIVEYTRIKPVQYFFGCGGRINMNAGELAPQAQSHISFNDLGGCGNTVTIGLKGSTNGGQFNISSVFPQESHILDVNVLSAKINTNHIRDNDTSDYFKVNALIQRYLDPWKHQISFNFITEESNLTSDAGVKTSYMTSLFYPKYRIMTEYKSKRTTLAFKAKALAGVNTILSDIDFFQAGYTGTFQTVFKSLYFSHQISYGTIETSEFNKFPLSMQYYLGGPGSNRGLSSHQINEGKSFFLTRNQVQANVWRNLLLGFFFDSGFCYNPQRVNKDYPSAGFLASYSTGYGNFELSMGRLIDDGKWIMLINVASSAGST